MNREIVYVRVFGIFVLFPFYLLFLLLPTIVFFFSLTIKKTKSTIIIWITFIWWKYIIRNASKWYGIKSVVGFYFEKLRRKYFKNIPHTEKERIKQEEKVSREKKQATKTNETIFTSSNWIPEISFCLRRLLFSYCVRDYLLIL